MFQQREWTSRPYNKVHGFPDADWAGLMPGRKSTPGYMFMLNGGAVNWRSFTQPVVAQSTAEAEYIALNEATREALYQRKLMAELQETDMEVAVIYEDMQPQQHGRKRMEKITIERNISISVISSSTTMSRKAT